MILTVTMNPSIDISYPLKKLEIDEVNRVKNVYKTAGGKGLNVSRVIRLANREVTATGIIGGFLGGYIEKHLYDENIVHNFYKIDQESRNSIAILHDNGKQTEILENGPTISSGDAENFLSYFDDISRNYNLVTMSGSLPCGLEADYYSKLVEIAKSNKAKILLDTSGEDLKTSLNMQIKPDLIKPNETEIKQLTGKDINLENIEEIKQVLNDVIFEDVEWICVSLGANGAIVKHNKNFYKANIPQITVANPVGSGDSTLAGLAIAIDEKRDVSEVIKYGMTMGMLNTMEKKTGYIDMNKFEEFYNKIDVISL